MSYDLSKYMSRRTRCFRLLIVTSVFVIGYLCATAMTAYSYIGNPFLWVEGYSKQHEDDGVLNLLETQSCVKLDNSHRPVTVNKTLFQVGRRLMTENNGSDSTYPKDVFTLQERRNGAVILHIFGMIYMFIALAVVCDEFFVPSLGVITKKLDISEDVSGATFMAAGGSAPELFTSIIGVFIANNDVGIGTIVGSAVFNILFVIGMCALFSTKILALTWWPLFRDVSFYSLSLLFLIGFFSDDRIEWWEALILFLSYVAYVTFMKYNAVVEVKLKSFLSRFRCLGNKVNNTSQLLNDMVRRHERIHGFPFLHSGSGHYRHGVVQLMIHTTDPITDAKVHDKAMRLQATLQVTVDQPGSGSTDNRNNVSCTKSDKNVQIRVISNGKVQNPYESQVQMSLTPVDIRDSQNEEGPNNQGTETRAKGTDLDVSMSKEDCLQKMSGTERLKEEVPLEEKEEPLNISWPDTTRKRLTYIFLAPIILPLYFTLPDVRRSDRRMFFPWTFTGSILWIAGYSYCMVWWANQTGQTIGIPDAVMGLTVLAAGTSIPDLITSVIVAKKGFGDMAVSSSVGSNIFDITVGLPVPWLMYSAVNSGDAYLVISKGMLCSILLLFLMMVAVIISIAASGWKMSRTLGISMLVFYVVFMTLAVLLEYEMIVCPAG